MVQEGFSDTNSAVSKILTGSSMINFDFSATGESLKLAATQYPKQLTLTPAGGNRYVALNTAKPPFNNINVRKAVIAASNRDALRNTRGGPLGRRRSRRTSSRPASRASSRPVEPPVRREPQYDFIQHPTGDMALAESYMKKAGYSSGKCTGNCTITMVSSTTCLRPVTRRRWSRRS